MTIFSLQCRDFPVIIDTVKHAAWTRHLTGRFFEHGQICHPQDRHRHQVRPEGRQWRGEFSETATATLKSVNDIKDDEQILDLGDVSAQKLADILKNAKTILWNGPVGVFEFPNFRKGTEIVANAIADSEGFSIAGGGDTLAAIDLFGIADKISYISTGGGAFLEFVEGKVLPAVAMLEERAKQ